MFGPAESVNFKILPTDDARPKFRMEEMISMEDMNMITNRLCLKDDSTYESIISGLYFSSDSIKQAVLKELSYTTKANFTILNSMISKHFDN